MILLPEHWGRWTAYCQPHANLQWAWDDLWHNSSLKDKSIEEHYTNILNKSWTVFQRCGQKKSNRPYHVIFLSSTWRIMTDAEVHMRKGNTHLSKGNCEDRWSQQGNHTTHQWKWQRWHSHHVTPMKYKGQKWKHHNTLTPQETKMESKITRIIK